MASTYKWETVVSMGETGLEGTMSRGHLAANLAQDLIWWRYPFRETLGELDPFYLIPNRDTYGSPFISIPSDYHSIYDARILYTSLNGGFAVVSKLSPVPHLGPDTPRVWPPNAITYVAEDSAFRLSCAGGDSIASPYYFVAGRYKKNPTKLTQSTLATTTIPFDDRYLMALASGVKWAFMELLSHPQAGQVQFFSNGRWQGSGQKAKALMEVEKMAQTENVADQTHFSHPEFGNFMNR